MADGPNGLRKRETDKNFPNTTYTRIATAMPSISVLSNTWNEELAYLDTHYYAGIKKYQWVTLPMALHGVVVKKDGTVVNVNIGDNSFHSLY